MARKLPASSPNGTAPGRAGSCVDCGNDAYIRLASQDGREEMICGHCYAERIRGKPFALKKVRQVDPDLKLPRPG